MWLLNKARKKAGGKRGRKGDAPGLDSDSGDGSDDDENGGGKGEKSKGQKKGNKGRHESSDSDGDDVDPKVWLSLPFCTCHVCACVAVFPTGCQN